MNGQISFGKQQQFFISIDWVLPDTLSIDRNKISSNGDECHSSTNAFILSKNDVDAVISG